MGVVTIFPPQLTFTVPFFHVQPTVGTISKVEILIKYTNAAAGVR